MKQIQKILFFSILLHSFLSAKTILILAGTSELGKHVIHSLSKDGFNIIVAARNTKKFQTLKEEIHKKYPSQDIEFIEMDYENVKKFKTDILKKNILSGVVLIPPRPAFDTPKGLKNGQRMGKSIPVRVHKTTRSPAKSLTVFSK